MKIAHYPWNVQLLADWLKAEISTGKSLLELANALRISQKILLKWLTLPAPLITLEQIQAIARYQNWDFDGTVQWLGIGLVHLEELREYSKIHSPSDASGDLMLTSTPETGVLDERFWMRESSLGETPKKKRIPLETQSLQSISYTFSPRNLSVKILHLRTYMRPSLNSLNTLQGDFIDR